MKQKLKRNMLDMSIHNKAYLRFRSKSEKYHKTINWLLERNLNNQSTLNKYEGIHKNKINV